MKRFECERGAVSVMAAVLIPVLIGILALSFDYAFAQRQHRSLQDAADAAALSAAYEYRQSAEADYEAAALHDAELNGYTEENSTIIINRPPLDGPKAGDDAYVEVSISQIQSRFFMDILGVETKMIHARAVAGLEPDNTCLYVLERDEPEAFKMSGNSDFEARNCRVHVNSDHSDALDVAGNATLTASSIGVVGGYSGGSITPTPETGMEPIGDPLASLPSPAPGPCDHTGTYTPNSGVAVLAPGVYCGGIKLNNNVNATFVGGTYIIYGGTLDFSANAQVNGNGVTFYLTEGPGYSFDTLKVNGSSNTTLSAPTGGVYKGILFFQDRTIVSSQEHVINGSAGMTLTGTMYAPTGRLHITGNADMPVQDMMIIVNKIRFSGSGTLIAQIDAGTNVFSPYAAQAYVVE